MAASRKLANYRMAYTLSPTEPIPVVLITGALGSGKTSLLSAILGKRTLRNSVVLINEFGAMGLDGDLLAPVHGFLEALGF